MTNARFWLAAVVLAGALLAACSGNFGSGTSAPGGIIPSGPLGPAATASPTPTSATGILNYGQSAELQPLPLAAGYGGAIAFSVPSPKLSDVIPVGVTVSLGVPSDSPDLNLQSNSKNAKKRKRRDRPARPLLYISLLATRDITLSSYPRFAVDIPRDVATLYREDELGIALYNPADKDTTFRLNVASLDQSASGPVPAASGSAAPSGAPAASGAPAPTPSAALTPSAAPSTSASPAASPTGTLAPGQSPPPRGTPTPSPTPTAKPTLPPQRVLFAGKAVPLKLQANKAAVFAVYAVPVATPSPSGSAAAAAATAEPEPSASANATAAPASAAPAATAAAKT